MDILTPEQRARVDAMLAWNRRKDDLGTVLTEEEWSQLRIDLRSECANHACLCQDGYCSQLASAEEARDELWVHVSYGHRRAQRAAHLAPHLAPQIAAVFFDHETDRAISYERLEEIAAGCRTEAQFAAAVKQEGAET